jgi:hypothetical protein
MLLVMTRTVQFPLDAGKQNENPLATDPLKNDETPPVAVEEEEENELNENF